MAAAASEIEAVSAHASELEERAGQLEKEREAALAAVDAAHQEQEQQLRALEQQQQRHRELTQLLEQKDAQLQKQMQVRRHGPHVQLQQQSTSS